MFLYYLDISKNHHIVTAETNKVIYLNNSMKFTIYKTYLQRYYKVRQGQIKLRK